jgi:hypothetical protein
MEDNSGSKRLQEVAGIALLIAIWSPLLLLLREFCPRSEPKPVIGTASALDYEGFNFRMHRVQPGESVESIAATFATEPRLIAIYNRLGTTPLKARDVVLIPIARDSRD